jgi:hypothetical protein
MLLDMENLTVTSEPAPKPTSKPRKRKMNAAKRKAMSEAAKLRWAAKKTGNTSVPVQAPQPSAPPPPAVLKLQEQVVGLVSQRSNARQRLSEAHSAYMLAQSALQAAEADVRGTEQDAQYLLGLIAQLENRIPNPAPAPVLQMPNSMAGVSSEPAPQPKPQANYAMGSADDLRRELRGMM